MASCCVSLVPALGGADEYIQHGINGYAVDPRDDKTVLNTVIDFIALEPAKMLALQYQAVDTAQQFSVRKAAISEVKLFSNI